MADKFDQLQKLNEIERNIRAIYNKYNSGYRSERLSRALDILDQADALISKLANEEAKEARGEK